MDNAEIQVGEYVRSSIDGIGKVYILGPVEEKGTEDEYQKIMLDINEKLQIADSEFITKHSFDLLDLIEAGDYVNGQRVVSNKDGLIDVGQEENYIWLDESKIQTIVTHEQMKSMEYKVGGENDR